MTHDVFTNLDSTAKDNPQHLGIWGSRMLRIVGIISVVAAPVFGILLSWMVVSALGGEGFPESSQKFLAALFALTCFVVFVLLVAGYVCKVLQGFREDDIRRWQESKESQ